MKRFCNKTLISFLPNYTITVVAYSKSFYGELEKELNDALSEMVKISLTPKKPMK